MKNIYNSKDCVDSVDDFCDMSGIMKTNNIYFAHDDVDNLHTLSIIGWVQENYKFSTEPYKIENSSIESLEKDLNSFNLEKYEIKQVGFTLYILKNSDF